MDPAFVPTKNGEGVEGHGTLERDVVMGMASRAVARHLFDLMQDFHHRGEPHVTGYAVKSVRAGRLWVPVQGNAAGELNGLSASTTNMTNACRSLDPLLTACIA
jgi:hypothetical protein